MRKADRKGDRAVGPYTFEEFKRLVREFHGYPAPGVLIGGYMVEAAKKRLPDGTLFEVVVETRKCLPDAVQLLTPCTTGNNWMRIVNLGRFALSIHDKHTGKGVRVGLDAEKLKSWPAINGWFFRLQAKAEQDSNKLLAEIEEAGDSILSFTEVRLRKEYLGKSPAERTTVCPICNEAYPCSHGPICKGCQGETPYAKE
jgi:formylmethanofuran dehydrogenase subunit E